ncbi:MAG: TlpA family protein disulfide reductase [Planctomycetes bacterium]|nr:TlpA family protein disulfide reductase [Planctomycetota bacterium]
MTTLLFSLLALTGQVGEAKKAEAVSSSRVFRGVFNSPGGELPFLFELRDGEERLDGWLINGRERIKISTVYRLRTTLMFAIDEYASEMVINGSDWVSVGKQQVPLIMDGKWWKRTAPHKKITLEFVAHEYQGYRFQPIRKPANAKASYPPITGRWAVEFSEGKAAAVGIFDQSADGTVEGTFLTTTGDYRYLAGSYEYGRLRLSVFDGAHAFLFDATMQADGTLKGDFWSRMSWHETWTAKRDESVQQRDGFSYVKWKDGVGFGSVRFPDVDGNLRRLDQGRYLGKARIIEVFGTWCPNCHDAAEILQELHERYHEKGLRTLGLAFEVSGEFQHDSRQVKRFRKRHNITFPLLVANEPEKKNVLAALPMLETTHAYPTTIFMREDGTIRAIHSGFSGPATGQEYEKLKKEFESIVREMLGLSPLDAQGTEH